MIEVSEYLQRVAEKTVDNALPVKSGDSIVFMAGSQDLDIAYAFASECVSRGAETLVMSDADHVQRAAVRHAPLSYFARRPRLLRSLIRGADWMIFMSGSRHDSSWMNDPALRDRIMEIRKAATWSMDNVLQECLDNRTHLVALLDPSLQQAQALGVTFEETKNRFLQSLDIDYDELSNLGNRLIARLSKAQHIHVTSPKGTDLTLSAVGRSWINDDGRTPRPKGVTPYIGNIPVGEIFVAPLEDSPVGVFAPEDFPGSPVHDVRIEFKKGQNATFVAGEGNEILQARLSRATGNPYVLGEFAIGTNPCGDPLLATEKAYATVHMAMGQNTWLGGKNECSVHMDMLVDKPTVEVDGEFILRDGKFWV